MSDVSIKQVNDAIANTLKPAVEAPNIVGVMQSIDSFTDGMGDTPTVQVYFSHGQDHSTPGEYNRGTFGPAPLRARQWTFNVDVYADQRGPIAQNMAAVVTLVSLIENLLDQENSKPLFGLVGIQDFTWYWDRVTFKYAGNEYAGYRAVLAVVIY